MMSSKQGRVQFLEQQVVAVQAQLEVIKKQSGWLAFLRLLLVVGIGYSLYLVFEGQAMYWIAALLLGAVYVFLKRKHEQVAKQEYKLNGSAVILAAELDALETGFSDFYDNGVQYLDDHHPYTNDLDIFGVKSIYHAINRCLTIPGQERLAKLLMGKQSVEQITLNQSAIAELSERPNWRIDVVTSAYIAQDTTEKQQALKEWIAERSSYKFFKLVKVLAYLSPVLMALFTVLFFILAQQFFLIAALIIGGVNLILFLNLVNTAQADIARCKSMNSLLHGYSLIIEQLEDADFKSTELQQIKQTIFADDSETSRAIQKLAKLIKGVTGIDNAIAAFITNTLFLYHVNIFAKLEDWKTQHAADLAAWVDAIGRIESLNALANFKDNNASATFPVINEEKSYVFEGVAHPLLTEEERVANSLNFGTHPFRILTGSNMSGKSTFLRTLGTNLVLANCGAPVSAANFQFYPVDIYAFMRLTDSLSDGSSYFFAEVKRLKSIIDNIAQAPSFILLDEILKGTNSEDKRDGTIGVIEKILKTNTLGVIATHDLEVCDIAANYPDIIVNNCFDSRIEDGEIVFDYKLKEGVCSSKSATFLMKKMEII